MDEFTFPSKSKTFHKQEELQNGDRGGREIQHGRKLLLPHVLFTFHSQSTVCKAVPRLRCGLCPWSARTQKRLHAKNRKATGVLKSENFWSNFFLLPENHWSDQKYKSYTLRRRCHLFRRRYENEESRTVGKVSWAHLHTRRQVDAGGEQHLNELASSWQSSYLQMSSKFSLRLNVITYSFKSLLSRLGSGLC